MRKNWFRRLAALLLVGALFAPALALAEDAVDIDAAGLAGVVSMPNSVKVNAMEFAVAHNNGVNCKYLDVPDKHQFEVRTVRQRFATAKGEIQHESVKYRITGVHAETQKGDIETGSPYGSTEKYSVLRLTWLK